MVQPYASVILAMSVDGKITDRERSPARFGSSQDRAQLEELIARMDVVLIGGATLRAYGTSLPITNPTLLAQRQAQGKPAQPVHLVVSGAGDIATHLPFFRQPVPHWLITTPQGASNYQGRQGFEEILLIDSDDGKIDWCRAWPRFAQLGWEKVGILGGGELVASLLEVDLVDELFLTVCPLILGGKDTPTLVEGKGFLASRAFSLDLVGVKVIGTEVFLHYKRKEY